MTGWRQLTVMGCWFRRIQTYSDGLHGAVPWEVQVRHKPTSSARRPVQALHTVGVVRMSQQYEKPNAMCSCCFDFNQCFCPLYFTIKGFKLQRIFVVNEYIRIQILNFYLCISSLRRLRLPLQDCFSLHMSYGQISDFRFCLLLLGSILFWGRQLAFATLYRALWRCQIFWPGTPACFLYTVISLQSSVTSTSIQSLQTSVRTYPGSKSQEPMINQSSSWLLIALQSNFNLYHESTTVTQCTAAVFVQFFLTLGIGIGHGISWSRSVPVPTV